MEGKAIYKDEHLEETKNLLNKLLEERQCGLVVAGEFIGDKIRTFIKIERIKKDETLIDTPTN
jgi:hypothetical protein